MRIELTQDSHEPNTGFEDRGLHQHAERFREES